MFLAHVGRIQVEIKEHTMSGKVIEILFGKLKAKIKKVNKTIEKHSNYEVKTVKITVE